MVTPPFSLPPKNLIQPLGNLLRERLGSCAFSGLIQQLISYKWNPQLGRSTAPPTSTPARNPITFQHLKCRRPIRNLDSKARPEELCSRSKIFLCDIRTFSEETFEFAKCFLCDFDRRCNIRFGKEGLSSEEEVCLVNQASSMSVGSKKEKSGDED